MANLFPSHGHKKAVELLFAAGRVLALALLAALCTAIAERLRCLYFILQKSLSDWPEKDMSLAEIKVLDSPRPAEQAISLLPNPAYPGSTFALLVR